MKLKPIIHRLLTDESGQDLIEYALVAGLVGLSAITILQGVATAIVSVFTKIQTDLNTASGATT